MTVNGTEASISLVSINVNVQFTFTFMFNWYNCSLFSFRISADFRLSVSTLRANGFLPSSGDIRQQTENLASQVKTVQKFQNLLNIGRTYREYTKLWIISWEIFHLALFRWSVTMRWKTFLLIVKWSSSLLIANSLSRLVCFTFSKYTVYIYTWHQCYKQNRKQFWLFEWRYLLLNEKLLATIIVTE